MMAMTVTRDVKCSSSTLASPSQTTDDSADNSMFPVHSGLSALIQAATSQLRQLENERGSHTTTEEEKVAENPLSVGSRATTPGNNATTAQRRDEPQRHALKIEPTETKDEKIPPARTPTIVPERDVRKQTFPEVLMTLLENPSNVDVLTFLPDGKFFAIRSQEFTKNLMLQFFSVATFEEFLHIIHGWGFLRIDRDRRSGIEIFRHPQFVRGDWKKCAKICFGETPTEVRLQALTNRAGNDSAKALCIAGATKRRLSTSHMTKSFETSGSSQKQKVDTKGGALVERLPLAKTVSEESGETTDSSQADDVRCVALAITTEKLNLKNEEEKKSTQPLVQRAVQTATHLIVTDAIESLLRDESHTRQTFLKHEKELSKSSIPGVVPISKQLFCPSSEKRDESTVTKE